METTVRGYPDLNVAMPEHKATFFVQLDLDEAVLHGVDWLVGSSLTFYRGCGF